MPSLRPVCLCETETTHSFIGPKRAKERQRVDKARLPGARAPEETDDRCFGPKRDVEPELAQSLRQIDLDPSSWSIAAVPHEQVAGELARQDAGIFFLTHGLSEHGCSPTKIGEAVTSFTERRSSSQNILPVFASAQQGMQLSAIQKSKSPLASMA